MKIIKILTISCLLYSCSNPLDKSILNPLEIEELKKVIENDTTFEKLYTEIQTFRESILENEIQQVKWMDLSYQSLLDYKDFNNDINEHFNNYFNNEFNHDFNNDIIRHGGNIIIR